MKTLTLRCHREKRSAVSRPSGDSHVSRLTLNAAMVVLKARTTAGRAAWLTRVFRLSHSSLRIDDLCRHIN